MTASEACHCRAAYVGNKLFEILLNLAQKQPVEQHPFHWFCILKVEAEVLRITRSKRFFPWKIFTLTHGRKSHLCAN